MSKPELYVSIDVETDGPVPGINSMLSLGAALFNQDDQELGTWYKKFRPLLGSYPDPETEKWWQTQPEAWSEVISDSYLVNFATSDFVDWLSQFSSYNLIAVGWPIAFDFPFVNYYCHRFTGGNPLGYAGLDIRSYINGILRQPSYYGVDEADIRKVAGEIDKTGLRPHVAVDDAIEQGRLFMAVRRHVINTNEASEALLAHNKKVQGNA